MVSLAGPTPEGVFTITLDDSADNRFTEEFFAELHACLDEVEAHDGPTALVVIGGGPKFFSNGFKLEWLSTKPQDALACLSGGLYRMLTFGVPTVCALNGHAFAGGTFFALSMDHRIMNSEKGFFSVNELDIGMGLPPAAVAIVKAKLRSDALAATVLTAGRLPAKECLRLGIVDAAVPAAELLQAAQQLAAAHAKKGAKKDIYRSVKKSLYEEAVKRIKDAGVQMPKKSKL